jgi:hypothetical protein
MYKVCRECARVEDRENVQESMKESGREGMRGREGGAQRVLGWRWRVAEFMAGDRVHDE